MSLLRGVAASLSTARLQGYRTAPDESNDAVLGRYLWNVALAEALYPTIHFLEVTLRNAFNGGIAMLAGPGWYDDADVLVNPRARAKIADAKKLITDAGHQVDGPSVIAGLYLGFWTGLCNREYEQGPMTPASQIPLWPGLLRNLGQLLPRELRTRAALSEFLGGVRIIRNRAYHHEPLWAGHRDRRGQLVPLSVDHARMQGLVETLGPSAALLMRLNDRFGVVFDAGPEPWAEGVREHCLREGLTP